MSFLDSISSLVNRLANKRNALNTNVITSVKLSDVEARAIYKTGIGSKICRIKSSYALNDTIQFDSTADEELYNTYLAKEVKKAAKLSVAFGRAIVVLLGRGGDLRQPLPSNLNPDTTRVITFGGDMVTATAVNLDLQSERYLQPKTYTVRGVPIHHTRVIDFKYVEPPELELPQYRYGGISEFELIRSQLVADEIVQRAVPSILEKSSTLFYKLEGFRENLAAGKTEDLSNYISSLEDLRSIHGAGIVDKNDEIDSISQALTNLSDSDMITLRRLAMVTGIPLALLVGENVKGLNSTGETEQEAFQDMIETLQADYLLHPISNLMAKFGKAPIKFKENQGQSPENKINFESTVIDNAIKLAELGKDYTEYLESYDVVKRNDYAAIFGELDDDESLSDEPNLPGEAPGKLTQSDILKNEQGVESVDPTSSLNGAQVTAILEIITRLRNGEISRGTAERVIATSFPVNEGQAKDLISEVPDGISSSEALTQ